MINILDGGLILTSIALVVSIILQSKGAGLGGLTGSDAGGVFTARRGSKKHSFGDHRFQCFIFCLGDYFGDYFSPSIRYYAEKGQRRCVGMTGCGLSLINSYS